MTNANFASVDQLGQILANIAELEKQAAAIKDQIKDAASKGGDKVIEGELFKATYIEANRATFDSKKFIEVYGKETYEGFTKTIAVFSVKVTSR